MKCEFFVPTWNSQRTLEQCLKSIRINSATAKITVIDRFSHDNTIQIAEKFNCAIRQSNENIGEARTTMIKLATADFMIMVDSDTYLSSTWLSSMISWFKTIKETDSTVAGLFGENIPLYPIYRKYMLWSRQNRKYPLKNSRRLLTCNLFLETRKVKGFQTTFPIYEDWLLGEYIISASHSFYVVPVYAQHDAYQSWSEIKKHCRWAGAGTRVVAKKPLWKMLGGLLYFPFFKTAMPFKMFAFKLQWNWLVGWWNCKKYVELKR